MNFDILVSLFVGSDIADQAHVFATVNLEQTKVGKSLAIDLFELARTRSPIKTCHNVAVALDTTRDAGKSLLSQNQKARCGDGRPGRGSRPGGATNTSHFRQRFGAVHFR